ncbi:MAG: hypothetical protein RL885_27195 [Planctomycetota bacterium]
MRIEKQPYRESNRLRPIESFADFGLHCRVNEPTKNRMMRRPVLPHEVEAAIERAIERLFDADPYGARAAVRIELEGCSTDVVARELGLDLPETFRVLSRGLRELRVQLAREGIDCR